MKSRITITHALLTVLITTSLVSAQYQNIIGQVYGNPNQNNNQYSYQNYYQYPQQNYNQYNNTNQNYSYPQNLYYPQPVSVAAVNFSVTTKSATNVSQFSSTLNGEVTSYGTLYGTSAEVYFEYGPQGTFVDRTNPVRIYGSSTINALPTNLMCGTNYSFRAVLNDGALRTGETMYFTTLSCQNFANSNYQYYPQQNYNPYQNQNSYLNPNYNNSYWSNYRCSTVAKSKRRYQR